MTDLLPCPFCGGVADLDTQRPYRGINGKLGTAVSVYCLSCSADMMTCRADVPDVQAEDLVEAWNRRTPVEPPSVPDAPRSRLAEIASALRDGLFAWAAADRIAVAEWFERAGEKP